jgi:hypothetical protein
MEVTVQIFGAQQLVDRMGKNEGVVDFPGGTANDLFGFLITQHGLTWADFPLLKNWEENLSITIYRNDDILLKADYGRLPLEDGDKLSYHVHTGCC